MAAPAKIGTEFRVNTQTADDQAFSRMAALDDGGFVVTWFSNNQDGSGFGVYAQRYNVDGSVNGNEFQVNTYFTDNQGYPRATNLADGGFVITWVSDNNDGSNTGIFGQRYKADGLINGGEFQINTHTANAQTFPTVAGLADGGFVVTWASNLQDGSSAGIYGQRYTANGTRNGGEFKVNTHTANEQNTPTVTDLADGGFVITWTSNLQDGSKYGVYGQRYNGDGSVNGGEFRVNTHTTNEQLSPAVINLADGGFVITWTSELQDGSVNGVYRQRYNGDGSKNGGEFQVNTYTMDDQSASSVTALADGGFVVIWHSSSQDAGGDYGIYGQRFNADGTKNGVEFQVNTHTTNIQFFPSVIALENGDFAVTWSSADQDGSNNGVYGQRFSIDLFSAGDDMVYLPGVSPGGGWQALGGDDRVIGGDSDDSVDAGDGDDYVTAGLGNDSVDGGGGSDWLYGQGDNDTINAGAGAMDVSLGGDGDDTINGEAGFDYMYGGAGNDTAHGGEGDDVAYGGAGNDELYGDDGADWLFGEAGNDKLIGGAGADLLMGGAGADEISGGAGNDWMWGGDMTGAGDGVADTFFFATNWGGDVIWDFENGIDKLDVSGAGITSFADMTIGTFGQFTTITSASGDIIYLRGAGDVAIAESAIDASDFIFA